MSERLKRLAVNEDGFLFDPVSGESYTVNPVGATIIKLLKEGGSAPKTVEALVSAFDVGQEEAERDLNDFLAHLRSLKLI